MKRKVPKQTDGPLILATLAKNLLRVQALLRDGADVDGKGAGGRTALHHAAASGGTDMLRALIGAGAKVSLQDDDGRTALHLAARNHDVASAELLLQAGALTELEDEHGNTALSDAVFESRGRGELIVLLRRYGADPDHKNKHGVSPSGLAETIANFNVKQWFTGQANSG
jgi:ankyrin repeat protein